MTRYLLIPFCLVLAATAGAQSPPDPGPMPPRLTLADAVARATAVSHRLAELQARGEAASAVVDQRSAARKPIVGTQLGYQRTNHVDPYGFLTATGLKVIYPDVPDNFRSRVELQWPIYTGGRLEALERAARAEATATGHDLAAARADLKLEVTRAFWALVTGRESARVLGEAVKRVDAQLADVRSRFEAGFVPPNDVLTVEAQRARQQVLFIEAQNLASTAEADLGRLVGAADGAAIELDAALDDVPEAPDGLAPEALVAEARSKRQDRAAIVSRIDSTVQRQAAASAGRLPTVSFVTGADYARPNPKIFPREDVWQPSWDIGVTVNWAAWDFGRTKADTAEAVSLSLAAKERLADFDTHITLEVRQRTLELASARAGLDAAREEVVSATEARRVVQERFSAGVATTTDLLDAQVALLQAELDRTRALASIRLAMARLDRAVGR